MTFVSSKTWEGSWNVFHALPGVADRSGFGSDIPWLHAIAIQNIYSLNSRELYS